MAKASHKDMLRVLTRFYKFAAPHWKMLVLAFAAMLVYAMVYGVLVMMVKPILDGALATEEKAQSGNEVRIAAEETDSGETDEPLTELEKLEKEGKSWLMGFEPVKAVKNFLTPTSLKQVAFVLVAIVAPLLLVSSFFKTYARERVLWSLMADLRIAVFEKLSGLSLSFFSTRHAGDLISRLTYDISASRKAVKVLFGDLILHPMKFVIFVCLALYYSWKLSLIAVVVFPLLGFTLRKYGKRIRRYSRKMLERLGDLTESINQMLSGIRVVKSFGMEDEENAEFREKNRRQLKRAFKLVRTRAWADCLPEFVLLVAFSVVLMVANELLIEEGMKVSTLAGLVAALVAASNPTKKIVRGYNVLQESLGAVDRIFDLLNQENEIEEAPDAVDLEGVSEGIEFDDVTFAYDDDPVLRNVNLYVPQGEVFAIVGETGAGKSTLLDLLPRFYDPQSGSVRIDGKDIRKIRRESLMENIAIVGQHPFLFNRTIAENIRYGRRSATDEEVRAAARAANVHEFVKSLPEGYETTVGERGGRLSGGQRQCVTMARAFLKDAPILILDEATSNLDSESEKAVQDALRNLTRDRTTFIIAHRLSTVRYADTIVVMKNGRIVEQGTHEELLARGGEYEKLHRLQFAEPAEQEIGQD